MKTPYNPDFSQGLSGPYDDLVKTNRPAIWCGLGSWHAGGGNVLRGDGSVSFLSATTPQTILGKLGTVDDGNADSNQ